MMEYIVPILYEKQNILRYRYKNQRLGCFNHVQGVENDILKRVLPDRINKTKIIR